ncbi:histidine kinase dimerization/phosphoacceptor domain -containing protein [Phenylobacterium deserti]|uniref:Histidine kinase n=1 Tax=Phenylobacterium deserti TaxID=1914756 RepID=A0A328ADJ5_9CAUL|nr:histidine kinase dimerization/phosphoacceptor domain -containing protein [Phenylobacterium deserti]RAK52577.1 histidine kinase [Phenylobacterium deserti]
MSAAPDSTSCHAEPIHIPGSIQPHGLLLIADRDLLTIRAVAGDVERRLGVTDWLGANLASVIGDELAATVGRAAHSGGASGYAGQLRTEAGELLDVSAHQAGEFMLVELEPGVGAATSASAVLGMLERAGANFERAANLQELCERAAREFRGVTGFDRVMVYRFLDDAAGVVLAEDRAAGMDSFLNHHFPGSDIPSQARALYVRNLVRVIPSAVYEPAPIRPREPGGGALDLSDSALRSVSPIHLRYLQNMGVGASASVSIVVDGRLWGLIACHHATPRLLTYDQRAACRTLASGLARQIKGRQEAEAYRERVRLRGLEDEIRELLRQDDELDLSLTDHLDQVRRMLAADSFALLSGTQTLCSGACPGEAHLQEVAAWVRANHSNAPFATHRLGSVFSPAQEFQEIGSGLLAVVLPGQEPTTLMWFRAERVQVVEWAGNPHAAVKVGPLGTLTPRSSFEAWREQVRGVAQPWSLPEIEAAGRLRRSLLELRQQRRLGELNTRLGASVAEKDGLLEQKEVLLREMNHRVQNSLALVSSFLALQARASDKPDLQAALEEARRRLGAVAMAHRRLYRADQIETIDMARYIDDLWADVAESLGPEWRRETVLTLAPILLPTDRAVTLGLILTELVINANKYAYGGAPGPLAITLEASGSDLRLIVADRGSGRPASAASGFGSRMMNGLVSQLAGVLEYEDNMPGLRAVLSAPISHDASLRPSAG